MYIFTCGSSSNGICLELCLYSDVYHVSPCRVGLVVSVSASHTVGHGFASRPGQTKDHKNSTN